MSSTTRPGSQILFLILVPLLFVNGTAAAAPLTYEYVASVSDSLKLLQIEARFSVAVHELSARSDDADDFLRDARDCDNNQPIGNRGRRMILPDSGIGCLSYTVDLARAAKEHRYSALLHKGNIIVPPSLWLWRPKLQGDTSVRIEFRLPENVSVSVPWRPLDKSRNVYEFSESPESAHAPIVFGNFDYRELEVPGATLRVALVNGAENMDNDAIVRWINATAMDVSLAYGRFPNPSPQVVVIPVGGRQRNSRSAVPFGRVIRDGGETVELQVDQTQPLDKLLGDWTATHEFSHLMLPYVDRRQRWISEGFAQYYQNVLLTRSGAYDVQYALQKLHDGYVRGTASRPDLSPNGAASGQARSATMKIYWSGAAIALKADVQLRELSAGKMSLDDILDRFQACCLPSGRDWSGTELFAKFDEIAGSPVFLPLYRQYADTVGFPDTSAVLERLGVSVTDGLVQIRGDAELQSIREAIFRKDAETASWRLDLSGY